MSNLTTNCKNLVQQNEILKSQVFLENKARKEWKTKWGFLLNFEELCLKEAESRGISKETYKRLISRRVKFQPKLHDSHWNIPVSENIPTTSSGLVGWRSRLEYSLERAGPLYVSPLHTMPKEPLVTHIILG